MVRGSHHTHAIYGSNLYLLSDPLNDIYREATQWNANVGEKISDLYVIAHGWNFTTEEALANYYGYLEVLERRIAAVRREDPTYNPYFVFVVWPSSIRPVTGTMEGLLPLEVDRIVSPLSDVLDRTVFFVPSVWKQSNNAYTIAIGSKDSSLYRKINDYRRPDGTLVPRLTCGTTTPNTTEYFTIGRSPEMGRDCSLSLLLNHIIDWKRRFSPTTHIHLVGHSFGAKIVTSAAVFSLALRASKPGVWLGDESGAIDSLVILNPAFDPEELHLPNDNFGKKPGEDEGAFSSVRMLERIPRKVLVYSDRDYATGRLFDLSQMIMSHSLVQRAERSLIEEREHSNRLKEEFSSLSMSPWIPTFWVAKSIFSGFPAIMAIYGSLINTATSVALGPPQWAINKLFYLPGDFVYHILKTDLFLKKEEATGYRVVLRGIVNAIDFVVPIWHVLENDPADRMGILRNPSPALGSTGLNLATAGRPINRRGISRLFENGQTPPVLFCIYSSRIMKDPSLNNSADIYEWDGVSQLDARYPRLDPNVLQSFDGTTVLDTWYPPDGAHGDVRSAEPPSHCSAQDEHGRPLQKREMIFNFVYNVTHAKLVPGLRSGAHPGSQLP